MLDSCENVYFTEMSLSLVNQRNALPFFFVYFLQHLFAFIIILLFSPTNSKGRSTIERQPTHLFGNHKGISEDIFISVVFHSLHTISLFEVFFFLYLFVLCGCVGQCELLRVHHRYLH